MRDRVIHFDRSFVRAFVRSFVRVSCQCSVLEQVVCPIKNDVGVQLAVSNLYDRMTADARIVSERAAGHAGRPANLNLKIGG